MPGRGIGVVGELDAAVLSADVDLGVAQGELPSWRPVFGDNDELGDWAAAYGSLAGRLASGLSRRWSERRADAMPGISEHHIH
jgi:hypothetical protein